MSTHPLKGDGQSLSPVAIVNPTAESRSFRHGREPGTHSTALGGFGEGRRGPALSGALPSSATTALPLLPAAQAGSQDRPRRRWRHRLRQHTGIAVPLSRPIWTRSAPADRDLAVTDTFARQGHGAAKPRPRSWPRSVLRGGQGAGSGRDRCRPAISQKKPATVVREPAGAVVHCRQSLTRCLTKGNAARTCKRSCGKATPADRRRPAGRKAE